MEILSNKIDKKLNFQSLLVRIVDIVNFEGPLMSLFQHKENKHIYILDWIDKNTQYNRWLVYRCPPIMLDKFVKGAISHYDLLESDEYSCFIVDIDTHLIWHNFQTIEKKNLPENYVPKADVFFEKSDCPNLPKLEAFIDLAIASKWHPSNSDKKAKIKKTYLIEELDMMAWNIAEDGTLYT